jgi:Zn finger protein HypA/HybF involved in hydrogenase expression
MFEKPNYHLTPNEFVDVYLKTLTFAETKILNVVFRKTFGFHKEFDYISISQFMDFTGLSHSAVISGTKKLIEKNMLEIKYHCSHCEAEFSILEKRFICPFCRTRESPNKLYTISMVSTSKDVLINKKEVSQKKTEVVLSDDRGSAFKESRGSAFKLDTKRKRSQKETITKYCADNEYFSEAQTFNDDFSGIVNKIIQKKDPEHDEKLRTLNTLIEKDLEI